MNRVRWSRFPALRGFSSNSIPVWIIEFVAWPASVAFTVESSPLLDAVETGVLQGCRASSHGRLVAALKMALVTVQILEGLERGRVLTDLPTPVTIGREDDNAIRLNDERVSRFHAKIQQDGERLILTDLDSTNGTRVNGHPVQLRVLRPGDQLSIGRCLLVFGSRDEIERSRLDRDDDESDDRTISARPLVDADLSDTDDDYPDLFPSGAPEMPVELSALHRAQVSDLLSYLHEQLGHLLRAGVEHEGDSPDRPVSVVDWESWQRLLNLQMQLAEYLRSIAEPGA